jgi:uncharacterized membrane protein
MSQFLRFAAIVLLVLIGFGTGICGLFGLVVTLDMAGESWRHADRVMILILSAVSILVTVGCFFGIRALARRMRAARQKPSP